MPVITSTTPSQHFLFQSGHAQTIFPVLFRIKPQFTYLRERIITPDRDFIDIDWKLIQKNKDSSPFNTGYNLYHNSDVEHGEKLAIVTHGLEGSASRKYVRGMVRALHEVGYDCAALNLRGCSGETNTRQYSYHSGFTLDITTVIDHALSKKSYNEIVLVGFSLGGNITLKYLGEQGNTLPHEIKKAAVFSVPVDLTDSSKQLDNKSNALYMRYFMRMLKKKIREKHIYYPTSTPLEGLSKMKTFREFDGAYTAPFNGFSSADEYWEKCSSKPLLNNIAVPTLLVNAKNDPFLGEACFPVEEAENNEHFFLEMPETGGHVGFVPEKITDKNYWAEKRAVDFFTSG
ncbi:MAG: YheT family hydrolase [Desulfovibrio sp.]